MKMIRIPVFLKVSLSLAFLSTLLCGLVYGTGQRILRSDANDPQIQAAEDIAGSLSAGADSKNLDTPNATDIAKSLSPFIIVYNDKHEAIASSGKLNGKTPTPPEGVFNVAKEKGANRLTWEPQKGVRIATVLVPFAVKDGASGYVLVARSLREVESREMDILLIAVVAWCIGLLGSVMLGFLFYKKEVLQPHSEVIPLHEETIIPEVNEQQ